MGTGSGTVHWERLGAGIHQVRLGCELLGLLPPPVALELQFLRATVGWNLVVEAPSGLPGQAIAWLQAMGATVLVREAAQPTTTVRAHLRQLPAGCAHVMLGCRLESLTLRPGGQATMLLRGKEPAVAKLVRELDLPAQAAVPLLTARQAELLTFCIAHGYYRIPRKVTLRQLSQDLGITATSLSLALRRAETKIVCTYAAKLPVMPPRA